MKEIAKQIETRFLQLGIKVEPGEIENKLEQLVNKYKVAPEEARRNVINLFLKKYNIPKSEFFVPRETLQVRISDIRDDENWVTIRAKLCNCGR